MRRTMVIAAVLMALSAGPTSAEDAAENGRVEAFAELPYWPGYWVAAQWSETMIGGQSPAVIEARKTGTRVESAYISLGGGAAPWNEIGLAKRQERLSQSKGRKANGWGYPRMMDSAAPIQFLITPEEVLIISPYNDVRHVYTDGREMPAAEDMWPTVWGTSVGHWEGDVLVIETRGVSDPSAYFHGGPPFSDDALYEERIWLEGDQLRGEITITDPATLTEPWSGSLAWVRDEGFDRMIHIDYDNDRTGFDGEYNTIEPVSQGD